MMLNVMWKWGLRLPLSVSELARFPAVFQDVMCEPVRRLNQKDTLRQKNGSWQINYLQCFLPQEHSQRSCLNFSHPGRRCPALQQARAFQDCE
ncbi:unnamed protein product [Gulo gulo]|uniref:Uncharacterized protein n=1 Tax=Gulo gulo TaxID=48420 RepID=A0A9X9LDS0_GULGU|nr:unnamed protein product [Gulo gulo]